MIRAGVVAAILLTVGGARADDPKPWEGEVRGTYILLGDHVQSGGFAPQIIGRRTWQTTDRVRLYLGAQFAMFGFGAEAKWLGILGGLQGGARFLVAKNWSVGAGIFDDVGRLPVCSNLGLCIQYVGNYPGCSAEIAYVTSNAILTANVNVRGVVTAGWSGPSIEPALSARIPW